MTRFATLTAAGTAALLLATAPAAAQNDGAAGQQPSRQQSRLDAILGALFGDRTGSTDSIEAQWVAGRTPLATQRGQFESRVDADVRSGALSQSASARLKSDYYELVQLEARYGADGRFTTQERGDLTDRYGALTQVLANGAYNDGGTGNGIGAGNDNDSGTTSVAEGQVEFTARVNAAVAARRITRTAGTRLRTDYAALVRTEAAYLRDGRLTVAERDDLEAQLDALDARVGDTGYGGGVTLSPRARLDAIARALPASGLSASAQAQLRVEHGDLMRLDAAYSRLTASADDRAYLDSRLANLELRARVRR